MKHFIMISCDIKQLKGVGEEWLVTLHGDLIAKFYNGNIIRKQYGNKEQTVLDAA